MGTIQRVLEQDIGMHDVFVGVEHRLRRSLNKLGKKGLKVTANEARSTSEGQEKPTHTSGVVFVAAAEHLVSVVDASCGKAEGLEGNEGRAAEMWIKCKGGLHTFAFHFWHRERWSVRIEGTLDHGVEKSSQHQKLMDCRV